MARTFVKPFKELPQIYRPRHQWNFPIWETRDEIREPHRVGFPKTFVNGQKVVLAKNGPLSLAPGRYVESVLVSLQDVNLPEAASQLSDQVTVTSGTTAVAADAYVDGFLIINGGLGAGHLFPVDGNTAGAGSAATDTITVHLGCQLPVALDTTTDIRLISSRYRNVRTGTGTGDLALGFVPIDVPANDYFWLITEGPTAAIAGEAITLSPTTVDLKPGGGGRLSLRNADNDEGTQLVSSLAHPTASAGLNEIIQVIARIGG